MNLDKFLCAKKELNLNNTIVIAVSGGIDSMSIFNMFLELRENEKFNIICAHINHNVRYESIEEEEFLRNFCKVNNCIFETIKLDKIENGNFHHEARILRYNFFESLLLKYNSKILITAHHGDDLMETILMRLTRGSSLSGYSGFHFCTKSDKDYYIFRPLINYTKKEITKYGILHNIEYRTDASNEKDVYKRNRIRKNIIPYLKDENEFVHEKFNKFSELLIKYDETIKYFANDYIKFYKENGYLRISKINNLPKIVVIEIIHGILKDYYYNDINLITDIHTKSIQEMIEKNKNISINLPNNVVIVSEYDKLFFDKKEQCFTNERIELILNKEITYNQFTISHTNDRINSCKQDYYINSDDIKLPLYIRTYNEGDKILMEYGSKKINRIFIDKKISKNNRSIWPIIVDSNDTIISVVNLSKSKYCKQRTENYDIIIKYEQGGNK